MRSRVLSRWTPHPVIVTIMDNRDYIRFLLYSYYTTITGWEVLLKYYTWDILGYHRSSSLNSLKGPRRD